MRASQTPAARTTRACEALSKAVRTRIETAPSPIDTALLLAAAGQALATAARLTVTDTFESRREAEARRATLMAEIDALAMAADTLDQVVVRGAGAALADALHALSAAFATEMNEVIGRLPSVRVRSLPSPISAWAIAQSEYGDDPAGLERAYLDIARRNRLRHPGRVPAGDIELLIQRGNTNDR